MDPEHMFIRVQERLSPALTPKVRTALEYIYLFIAITLFCVLVVMHANYVQQPGCSSEFTGIETTEAELIQIKITSAGLWSQNESDSNAIDIPSVETALNKLEVADMDEDGLMFSVAKFWLSWIGCNARKAKFALKFWMSDTEPIEPEAESSTNSQCSKPTADNVVCKTDKEETHNSFTLSAKEAFKSAIIYFGKQWYRHLSFICRYAMQIFGNFQKLWNTTGIPLNVDVPKLMHVLFLDRISSYAVLWLEYRSKAFEPTYLYTVEKGYFLLQEADKTRHNVRTANISISVRHPCFGNRWQQLLINRFVGYDTILMNSLRNSLGQGYLYIYQTEEVYNLSYQQEPPEGPAKFGDYLVTKCGVLTVSLIVFFTTTMSVSFTLREIQTRMLKFTVQLQHHAQHRLPAFQLIFVHAIESLVFAPIMIGILFFLFEFYDDQLLAFMVLILVWLCELFTLISVRTPISLKFFPRFFLLYFLVFHIYFFTYAYGFSYTALGTAAAFTQHLILYFWNHFEVPARQRFMQARRLHLQQHPDFHRTSSTILASTFHRANLNTRISGPGSRPGSIQAMPGNRSNAPGPEQSENNNPERVTNPMEIPGQPDIPQAETGPSRGSMNSFSSLLLWILGGAPSEGLNSFLSMFRHVREQGQVFADSPQHENRGTNVQ